MARITTMSFDIFSSDIDIAGGVKLKGYYISDTPGAAFDGSQYGVYTVVDAITTKPVPGTLTFQQGGSIFGDGTFVFSMTEEQAAEAGLGLGTSVTYSFYPKDLGVWFGQPFASVTFLCFYPGTMIATPSGDVAVETLSIGDLVLRQDGSAASVRWMGRNTASTFFGDSNKVLPIRIRKDALAENVPSRDLLVSPDHAVLVDDILVQAGALVNGSSIVRETDVPPKFVYYHIELADHALIMAENTPSETFIDNVDRMAFDNWAEHEALYGDRPALTELGLPRAKSPRQMPAATRRRLAERATQLGYAALTVAA